MINNRDKLGSLVNSGTDGGYGNTDSQSSLNKPLSKAKMLERRRLGGGSQA